VVVSLQLPFLLKGNAPVHSAITEKRILESSSVVHISHLPSSTHQASTDFSVYPAVKTTFKGEDLRILRTSRSMQLPF